MKILFHKNFEKQFIKLSKNLKIKTKGRITIFEKSEYDVILNNHALHGKFIGYRSINITSDIRVVYKLLDNHTVIFTEIGSHSNLYS